VLAGETQPPVSPLAFSALAIAAAVAAAHAAIEEQERRTLEALDGLGAQAARPTTRPLARSRQAPSRSRASAACSAPSRHGWMCARVTLAPVVTALACLTTQLLARPRQPRASRRRPRGARRRTDCHQRVDSTVACGYVLGLTREFPWSYSLGRVDPRG